MLEIDLTTVLWMLAAALLAAFLTGLYFILTHRRNTPPLDLDPDQLPPIDQALALMTGVTGSAAYRANGVRVLQNGALFPAMLEDIAAARSTVHLESFVWHTGELERRFVDLLAARAREGVQVRVLLDFVGAITADLQVLMRMVEAGAQVIRYRKPHWWNLRRFAHRSHRKLLIVDGAIAYTFGHGIGDEWLGDAEDERHWRDTGVRLEGSVVHALQSVFMENWIEESRSVPAGSGCFPELRSHGAIDAHVVSSACAEKLSSVALLYTIAIACARREVYIQNPYFVPGDAVVELLGRMVRRGVAVHLMVPGRHTDNPLVRRAGQRLYADLLRAGVRLYEFEPTLLHQKIVVVDGVWSHIGSTNFDARSLAYNKEVGIGLLDAGIAAELQAAFAADLARSREITLEDWKRRPWYSGLVDFLAYRLHAQL